MKSKYKIILLVCLNALALGVLSYIALPDNPSFLSAIQAIILAATLALVWWYAEETQKIRETANEQIKLLKDQLELTTAMYTADRQFKRPIIVPRHSPFNVNEGRVDFNFTNLGTAIEKIKVETNAKQEFLVRPLALTKDESGVVIIKGISNTTNEVPFCLTYVDSFGQEGSKKFVWERDKGTREADA